MKKRMISVFLGLVLIFAMCPPLSAAGAETTIYSCDFENGTESLWYAHGGWGGEYCTLETDKSKVYADSCAARLTYNDIAGSAYFADQMNITGGASYRVTGYIEGDVTNGDGFIIEVMFGVGSANSNVIGSVHTPYYHTTNGVYVKVELEFTLPAECDIIMIRPRLYGIGTMYVDNIELVQTAGPTPFSIETSHVFHYTGQKEGTASAFLHSYYGPETDEGKSKAVFTIRDGSTVVKTETIPFTDHAAVFTYSVEECLQVKQKRYDFTVQVKMPDGTVALEHNQGLYLYDRPACLNENGEYIMEGKVFNPVIAYHVNLPDNDTPDEDNAYLQAKKAGINVVQVPMGNSRWGEEGTDKRNRLDHALEQLEKYDLYGIFCLYSSHSSPNGNYPCSAAGCESEISNTRAMAEKLANEKRVFAWAIMDEPLGHGRATADLYAQLEQAYHEIRQRDSLHPVYTVDFTPTYFADDLKYCDVFVPDIYSTTQTGVFEKTTIAVEEAKKAGNKPIYTLVKAYMSDATLSFTTPDILRHVVYQAVLAGADGVGYYSFSDCINSKVSGTGEDIPINKTELWPMMLQLKEELPALFETAIRKEYAEEKTKNYILRKFGERSIILPLCETSAQVPIGGRHGAEILFGGEERLLSGYSVLVEAFTPILLEYGHEWSVWKDGNKVKMLTEGEHTLKYAGETADLYAAVYCKNGELFRMFTAKNAAVLVVTVPEGEYTLSAFAFSPGSLRPLTEKKDL